MDEMPRDAFGAAGAGGAASHLPHTSSLMISSIDATQPFLAEARKFIPETRLHPTSAD